MCLNTTYRRVVSTFTRVILYFTFLVFLHVKTKVDRAGQARTFYLTACEVCVRVCENIGRLKYLNIAVNERLTRQTPNQNPVRGMQLCSCARRYFKDVGVLGTRDTAVPHHAQIFDDMSEHGPQSLLYATAPHLRSAAPPLDSRSAAAAAHTTQHSTRSHSNLSS